MSNRAAGAQTQASPAFKQGYPACTSRQLFDQLSTAVAQKDQRGQDYLMSHGCIVVKAGTPVSVLGSEGSFAGILHVRAYTDTSGVELWTYREAIAGD